MKNALNSYHPAAAALPFAAAIGFTMMSFHPVYSAVSFICSFILAIKLNGQKALRLTVRFCLPIFIITVLINTAFNKNGITVMFYVGDRAIPYEGLLFGLCSGAALAAVLLWFSCYSSVIDSEKFLFLTGRFSPNAALLVSMTLGQVSQMNKRINEINDAQIGIYGEEHKKTAKRLRLAMLKISVLLSWSMEDSVQTADSMHARAYGTGRMTKMNPYTFGKKDIFFMVSSLSLVVLIMIFTAMGKTRFLFYPVTQDINIDPLSLMGYCVYFALLSLPVIIEMKETVQWRFYISKI